VLYVVEFDVLLFMISWNLAMQTTSFTESLTLKCGPTGSAKLPADLGLLAFSPSRLGDSRGYYANRVSPKRLVLTLPQGRLLNPIRTTFNSPNPKASAPLTRMITMSSVKFTSTNGLSSCLHSNSVAKLSLS